MSACWRWPSPRRRSVLAVALPGSVLSVEATLLLKTVKAGIIARLLAVFRVSEVAVFSDPDTSDEDRKLLALLLNYAVIPPHLKRKIVPLSPELRYVGAMQPLRIPTHDPPEEPVKGAIIQGLVESCRGSRCRVYLGKLGYSDAFVKRGAPKPRSGEVVLIRIIGVKGGKVLSEIVDKASVDFYTGYSVREIKGSVEELVEEYRGRGFTIVATSKFGECTGIDRLCGDRVLLVFGGPRRGLLEYTERSLYDYIVNTVPLQGTVTVRTEEALASTLALYNYLCR